VLPGPPPDRSRWGQGSWWLLPKVWKLASHCREEVEELPHCLGVWTMDLHCQSLLVLRIHSLLVKLC